MKKIVFVLSIALLPAILVGCSAYYEIKDPATDSVYYTTKLDRNDSGSISFTDAKTNSAVTLQNSEVNKISSDEWDQAMGK